MYSVLRQIVAEAPLGLVISKKTTLAEAELLM